MANIAGDVRFNVANTGHIVSECLPFIKRSSLFDEVVHCFSNRYKARSKVNNIDEESDKRFNLLTVLKSTALKHFPASEEYFAYHRDRQVCGIERLRVSTDPPIICAVTFK